MMYKDTELLEKLSKVNWETARRGYGNNHCGLIGLLNNWWIGLSDDHFTLSEIKTKSKKSCDSVLGIDKTAVGILEVEGWSPDEKPKKDGKLNWQRDLFKFDEFFKEDKRNLGSNLEFAILLVYPTTNNLEDLVPPLETIKSKVMEYHCQKSIIIISLTYENEKEILKKDENNIRNWAKTDQFKSSLKEIESVLVKNGEEKNRLSIKLSDSSD